MVLPFTVGSTIFLTQSLTDVSWLPSAQILFFNRLHMACLKKAESSCCMSSASSVEVGSLGGRIPITPTLQSQLALVNCGQKLADGPKSDAPPPPGTGAKNASINRREDTGLNPWVWQNFYNLSLSKLCFSFPTRERR